MSDPGMHVGNDGKHSSGLTRMYSGTSDAFGDYDEFSKDWSVDGRTALEHHLNGDVLPHLDNYHSQQTKNQLRPTLEELHLGEVSRSEKQKATPNATVGFKFGWIQGVLIRCLLNIWGVMLFLRLSWIVAQAGVGQTILVVLLATTVTTLTALSMSAISTNGQIKGGGTYYMISRSLGPEFGAAIGIIFALANAMAVAMHTVGFCESLNDLLAELGVQIVDNGLNDIRIIGSITILVLSVIVGIGMEWEAKAQLLFMGILVVALGNFIVGSILGPMSLDEKSKGFIGYNAEILTTNFYADYRVFSGVQYQFFSVFAIFFPAATGILAGANISGDLKDPSHAIPKGTLLAIGLTSFSYIVFAIIAGATVLRDATGNPDDYVNGTVAEFMQLCSGRYNECDWGLHNSYQVMTLVSAFGPLNYAGCFAATLSSALACFVSAPKVFQALCRDRLFPYIYVFGKGYGKNEEPLRAYALTFVIAFGFIMIADLNVIAPLITNCYLASYALVNFSTFHVDLIRPISWRPKFKYFNKWLSLVGCVLSFAAMFLCSWPYALATTAAVCALFLIVKQSKPQVNWGSSGQAQTYKTALITVQQLNATEEHVKTYTPQVLVMTGSPNMRPSLVDFSYLICKNHSLMVCGDVIEQDRLMYQQRSDKILKATKWLRAHKTKAFYTLVDKMSFSNGVHAMLQATGIGRLRPNILLLGYQSDWTTGTVKQIDEYFTAIHMALEMHVAVTILRVQEGLDFTGILADYNPQHDDEDELNKNDGFINTAFEEDSSSLDDSGVLSSKPFDYLAKVEDGQREEAKHHKRIAVPSISQDVDKKLTQLEKKSRDIFRDPQGNELSPEVVEKICRFKLKQKKGTIDVWWLYDDGGLSMLLPHILTTRSNWANSRLRVFCLADEDETHQTKQENMKLLLKKFRIPVSDVIVIPDITAPPSAETRSWFDDLTRDLVHSDDGFEMTNTTPTIQLSELAAQKHKTFSYMRLRELLLEFSKDANLVVLTMPLPRKGSISGPLYMAWLETLTADMPPFLLVRGNQRSVLTYYS